MRESKQNLFFPICMMKWYIKITICSICDCLKKHNLDHVITYVDDSQITVTDCGVCHQPNSKLVLNIKMP